jgi:hypothetical protein
MCFLAFPEKMQCFTVENTLSAVKSEVFPTFVACTNHSLI